MISLGFGVTMARSARFNCSIMSFVDRLIAR
jgi:hypothetical protein